MKIQKRHLLTHGAGALRQWVLIVCGRGFRFSIGGYGNIPAPIGCWCLIPRIKHYRNIASYLHWLNMSVSYLYRCN